MRRSDEDLQKHTLSLYEGDFVRLQELYPELGASLVIRRLVRKHIKDLDPKAKTIKVEVDL
jgi:hypothetical protein